MSALLPSGGRRVPRPSTVETCGSCRAPLGLNYDACPACQAAVEQYWEADWTASLAEEGVMAGSDDERLLAAVTALELDAQAPQQAWTVVDAALKRLRCPDCQREPGTGPLECERCSFTFGNVWGYDAVAGPQGRMTKNEHALRVGRWVLRAPHRFGGTAVLSWRLFLPRLLTGWLPTTPEAQRARAWLNQGRVQAVEDELRRVDERLASEARAIRERTR